MSYNVFTKQYEPTIPELNKANRDKLRREHDWPSTWGDVIARKASIQAKMAKGGIGVGAICAQLKSS